MGYQALLKRENVYGILQDTLNSYYKAQCPNKPVSIGYNKVEGAIKFRLVPFLGIIMPVSASDNVRRHYYDCFHLRGGLVKRVGAKLLVFLNTHFNTSQAERFYLYVSPSDLSSNDTIYKYLNRSIRIFDFSTNRTVSIQKVGFTSKFFLNQLNYRLSVNYSFIPPIYSYSDNWFEEDILPGLALARVTDNEVYQNSIKDALDGMKQIAEETAREVIVGDYIKNLKNRIDNYLSQIKCKKNGVKNLEWLERYAERLFFFLSGNESPLLLVKSHGDFQAGNIWVSPSQTYIIDWETVDDRSAWFDAVTITYGTRYYGGIKSLYEKIRANNPIPEFSFVKETFLTKTEALGVFLLEDLLFYMEDMIELSGDGGVETLDRYVDELKEIDWNQIFKQ